MLANRGAPPRPGPSASSSSSSVAQNFTAPQRGEVARACEHVCGVPCNLRVDQDRATQQKAAVDGAIKIAQEEPAHWDHSIAIQAWAVAAILAALATAAAQAAAAADERREAKAAHRKRRLLLKPAPPRRPPPRRRQR